MSYILNSVMNVTRRLYIVATKVIERVCTIYTQRERGKSKRVRTRERMTCNVSIDRLNTEGNAFYSCIECTPPCSWCMVYVLVH